MSATSSVLRSTVLCALLVVLPLVGTAQPTPPPVDSLGRALVESHPGSAVIGLLDPDTSTVHGFGAVDSTGARPTARTLFEIGSITKAVTGLLLADAIERSSMDAATPVRALLPDSVAWHVADSVETPAPTMTLGHLATHHSGLPRLPSNLNAARRPTDPYAAYGDSALYAFLDGYTLPRAPGADYQYSNLGMGLLGHLLARRADTTYATLVRHRISRPLGLSDTRIHLTEEQQGRFAQGHNRAGAPTPPWHFEALAGAGALRSTAADMLALLRAHRRALSTATDAPSPLQRAIRRATTPQAPAQNDSRIGYGWHQLTRDGHAILWHSGGTGGFRSFVGLDRDTGHGVVVLVGAARPSPGASDTGLRLLRVLRSE